MPSPCCNCGKVFESLADTHAFVATHKHSQARFLYGEPSRHWQHGQSQEMQAPSLRSRYSVHRMLLPLHHVHDGILGVSFLYWLQGVQRAIVAATEFGILVWLGRAHKLVHHYPCLDDSINIGDVVAA